MEEKIRTVALTLARNLRRVSITEIKTKTKIFYLLFSDQRERKEVLLLESCGDHPPEADGLFLRVRSPREKTFFSSSTVSPWVCWQVPSFKSFQGIFPTHEIWSFQNFKDHSFQHSTKTKRKSFCVKTPLLRSRAFLAERCQINCAPCRGF